MKVQDILKNKLVTKLHKVWIDSKANKATFPLFSTDSRLVGFQVFNPDSKIKKQGKSEDPSKARYFTWSSEPALWGLDTVPQDARVVYVTEAIFRSTALHSVGVPSVSVLGSSMYKPLLRLLNNSRIKFVWVGDPDVAGSKLISKFKHGGIQSPKDLDEMTHKELLEFSQLLKTTFEE